MIVSIELKGKKVENLNYKLIGTIVVYFFSQLLIAFFYINPVDVIVQMDAAIKIANGQDLYQNIQPVKPEFPYPTYPPVYLYYLAGLFTIFGASVVILKVQLIIINCLLALLIYKITENAVDDASDKNIPYYTMILFILLPINWMMIYAGFFDNFVILFTLLSILYFGKNTVKHYLLSGLFLGIAIMSKQFPLLLIPLFTTLILTTKKWFQKQLAFFGTLFLTTLTISLPFIGRERYLNDLIYHISDDRPSISLYYYFLPQIDKYSVLMQLIALLALFHLVFRIAKRNNFSSKNYLLNTIWVSHLAFSLFIALNRIVYPHYFGYVSFLLPIITVDYYHSGKNRNYLLLNLIFYTIAGIGLLLYGYLWQYTALEDIERESIFYYISSAIYNIGMMFYLIFSLILYIKRFEDSIDKTVNEN